MFWGLQYDISPVARRLTVKLGRKSYDFSSRMTEYRMSLLYRNGETRMILET